MGVPLTTLLDRPKNADGSNYHFVLDNTVLQNADLALTWAFNIPRGWWGRWRHITPAMMAYLKIWRVLVLALVLVLLFRRERKTALFGMVWFFITLLPTLPLLNHFIPYYLFLPIAGLSLVAGTAFTFAYDFLRGVQPLAGGAFVAAMFAGLLYITGITIGQEMRDNRMLGGSAELALNSLTDLKRLYPELPRKATLYFDDLDEPLVWDQSWGGLLKMAYNTDEISVQYASLSDSPIEDSGENTIFLGVRDKHIVDKTFEYRANPGRFTRYIDSEIYRMEVFPSEVTAGSDKYSITVTGIREAPVRIIYRLNGGLIETFTAGLDAEGRATFQVGPKTRKGVYRFLGFYISGQKGWIRSDKTITVR